MKRLRGVFAGGVSQILIGSLIGQGLLLAVSPILTRLYSPRDFAALTVFTGAATVFGGLATLSWDRAIVVPRGERQATAILTLGAITVLTISVLLVPLALFLGPVADRVFDTDVFVPLWWLLPVTVALMGAYTLVSSWMVRQRLYGRLAVRNALLGGSQSVSSVILGVVGAAPFGLVSGIAFGRAVAIIGLAPWRELRGTGAALPSRARLRAVASRYRRFPLVASWSRVANILGLQLPPVLIVAMYGSWEAGIFALTVRVLATPIGIVVDAVSQYFEGAFAARVRERSPRLVPLMTLILRRLALVGLVPTLLVVFFAPALFGWLFGAEWQASGVFAQIVVWQYLLQFVVSPISRTLLVLERQFSQLVWDVYRTIASIGAVVLPSLLGASLAQALIVLTITQAVLYVILLAMSLRAARRAENRADGVGE